jgi:two-component system, chemotaxis family, CheB/CheR fusion protein
VSDKILKKIRVVKFTVKDTGIGIPQEKVEQMFKFFSTFDSKEGYGLGLAISNSLASSLGPEIIKLKSVVGEGSKFSFLIYQNLNE